MPGRNFNANTYRYGFNGQEKVDEIYGSGNAYDFTQRMQDPRLGRFFSIDPLFKKYPELTPYQFASNRPIDGIDLDGLEHVTYTFAMMPNGAAPKLIKATHHEQNGKLGHGIAVRLVDANGKVKDTFIPTSEPPKPPSTMDKVGNSIGSGLNTLQSKMTGTADNSEYEGEDGMEKGADLIDNTGKVFKATGIGAPIGEGMSLMADGMKTGLDFKNKDAKTALTNLGIRVVAFGAGKVLDKFFDTKSLNPNTASEEAKKLIGGEVIDQAKGALVEEKK